MSRRILLSILGPSSRKFSSSSSSSTALHAVYDFSPSVLVRRTSPIVVSLRHASTDIPSKTIVLEKPDKFRPPSHSQRLNRKPPRQYPGPPLSEPERQAQKTKRYPSMFPSEGTSLHWFLTNRWIHLYISLGTLTLLATISLTQSFLLTSPFGHLVPPISSLPLHPIAYVRDWLSTIRMHQEYESQKTAESRANNILDAQKRRLYRRAHGMEDLDADEDQGIDVRGLVAWDDGLTNKERRQGGRVERRTGRKVLEEGGKVGDSLDADPVRVEGVKDVGALGQTMAQAQHPDGSAEQEHSELKERFATDEGQAEAEVEPRQKRKKVKKWLGIWE